MSPSDYFNEYFNNEYFPDIDGGPPPPVPIQTGSGGNPTIVVAPMGMTWLNSGLNVNNLSLYPRRIFWDDPQNAGDVLQIEDGSGTILFKATAVALHDSKYVIITGGSQHLGGTRWRDWIVTQMDSGALFIWFT